jgi:hypothetical protein
MNEQSIQITETGLSFHRGFQDENWAELHQILLENSKHYRTLFEFLEMEQKKTGFSRDQLSEFLSGEHDDIRLNKTGIEVLTDWGERLGGLQRNVFTDRYYQVCEESRDKSFLETLEESYQQLEQTGGVSMRQRYVSIPRLRESVCERLRTSRDTFDKRLKRVAQNQIGRMELSGAPLDSSAKEANRGIKKIVRCSEEGNTTTRMESDRAMQGVELANNKVYYYLAIFDL